MDTINTMAASAAKAVWGENKPSTEEPVSGRLGDTSKGEPYDAGNIEPTDANAGDEASANGATKSRADGNANGDANSVKVNGTTAESDDSPKGNADSEPNQPSRGPNDTESAQDTNADSKAAPKGANDPLEEGEAPDVDGPGPKPLQEVAKENGGDAGNHSTSSVESEDKKDEKPEEAEAHENKGTGEKYEKTTGLQADGGDFDATRPGAGREADRLMEEKGMHNPTDPNSTGSSSGNNDSPSSGKKSLGQKIKDKLHRH